jgi:glycine/D-amino acid oxidase-like deaminating enzyme
MSPSPHEEPLKLPARVDVVIVGSGFTGLSAALTLARRGRSVAVLEANSIGHGASTRNGGQVGSGNQKFRVRDLIRLRGEKLAAELLHEGVAMLDYIEQLVSNEKIDCHFHRYGRFRGAVRPSHYEAMARDMDDLRRLIGVESYSVPKVEQHREIGTDAFHGGSVLPKDAGLHPGLFHAGLVRSVRAAGGSVHGRTRVLAITQHNVGFSVQTEQGRIDARDVIIATNGYTRNLIGYLDRRIVPVQSAIIATDDLPAPLLDSMMPTRRMYGNTNRAFSYFRAAPAENRMLWGGRVGRLAAAGSGAAFAHLAADLLRVFPQAAAAKVTHGWVGNIGYTFDDLPHLGRTPDGVYFAMGYCGTGVSRSTFFGNKIALKLLGDRAGATPFDQIAMRTHAFHFLAKPAVPIVETAYRLRDHFDL